jgi:hypothetical protein
MPPLRLQSNCQGGKRLSQMSRQGSTSSRRERGSYRPNNVRCSHGASSSRIRVFYALAFGRFDAPSRAGAGDDGDLQGGAALMPRLSALYPSGARSVISQGTGRALLFSSRTAGRADTSGEGLPGPSSVPARFQLPSGSFHAPLLELSARKNRAPGLDESAASLSRTS